MPGKQTTQQPTSSISSICWLSVCLKVEVLNFGSRFGGLSYYRPVSLMSRQNEHQSLVAHASVRRSHRSRLQIDLHALRFRNRSHYAPRFCMAPNDRLLRRSAGSTFCGAQLGRLATAAPSLPWFKLTVLIERRRASHATALKRSKRSASRSRSGRSLMRLGR